MSFPTVAGRTTGANASALGSHSIGLGSPSAGQLIVAFVGIDDSVSIFVDTAVSGYKWHEIALSASPTQIRSRVFWKVAEGGDALSIYAPGASAAFRSAYIVYRISGHQSAVQADSTVQNTASTNANPPSTTLTGSAQDILALALELHASTTVATGAPAGYGTLTTQAASAAISVAGADRTFNGTTEDPGAFTTVSARWQAWTILIPGDSSPTTNTRATQEAVEAVSQIDASARISQVAAEVVSSNALTAYVTQVAVEMVSTNVPDDAPNNDAAIVGFFF